jgi:hypothetical protein
MFKQIAITLSATALVMVAIALAPAVPMALATVSVASGTDDTGSSQPFAEQSCAAFETWFLDPACSQGHIKKTARTKHHTAHG